MLGLAVQVMLSITSVSLVSPAWSRRTVLRGSWWSRVDDEVHHIIQAFCTPHVEVGTLSNSVTLSPSVT